VTLQKNKYFTSNLSYIKLKLGQQIGGGTSNSKPLGPIIMMSQSETLSSSEILFITLFSADAHSCCCGFHQPMENSGIMPSQNHFAEPNQHNLTNCTTQHHILSTAGDALIHI
jgi:hypothetical protein